MAFSSSGDLLAWSNGLEVQVAAFDGQKWIRKCKIEQPKVNSLTFSPKGSILATWEVYATKTGQTAPTPNMNLWNPKSGEKIASFTQKKSVSWTPQWSNDEQICCIRTPNNEVAFFKDNNFASIEKRLSLSKMDSFSLSPGGDKSQYHIVCFVPGQKGGPGFGKLFTYPNFNPEKDVVASKSFFQVSDVLARTSYK